MSLILIYNDRTETIEFLSAFDEYCSIFDEICNVIMETFNLTNLLSDYYIVYYDSSYGLWINFNIHVTKRITELIRYSSSKTLKIRIERRQRNTPKSFVEKKIIDTVKSKATENDSKLLFLIFLISEIYYNIIFIRLGCAHMIIWLDEHIGNPQWHKQLKRDCRAMINTNTSFITNDNIDTLIQYNSCICHIEPIWRPSLQYVIGKTTNYSCPFQCALFTADNTDKFFEYLNMALELTRSLSIIISTHFVKEMLPIILSRQQKQLLPEVLFLYVLCSNIQNYYDWGLHYVRNNNVPATTDLQFFDDEQALFVRLLNDVRRHLTLEADIRRRRKETWHALQYYSAARQLFLNSLPWDTCYTLHELDNLDQLIKESEEEVNESIIRTFSLSTINDKHDDDIAQECAEILEGI